MIWVEEKIPKPKYKRHKGDTHKLCPYCGHQFLANWRDDRYYIKPWRIRKCKGCGREFLYINYSKSYVDEHKVECVRKFSEVGRRNEYQNRPKLFDAVSKQAKRKARIS